MGTAQAMPMMFMYSGRLRAGMTSATMAWDSTMSPPPPRPCTARPAIIWVMSKEMPQTTDPTVNSTSAPTNIHLRPMRSPSLP